MYNKGDRVIYSGYDHKCTGFVGTIGDIYSRMSGRRGDRLWYCVDWDSGYKGIKGYYQGNLSLYVQPEPDWEV
jgi:hypothetical protein